MDPGSSAAWVVELEYGWGQGWWVEARRRGKKAWAGLGGGVGW